MRSVRALARSCRTLACALALGAAALAPTAALAADPIKIGFSMSLTGGLAGGGKSVILAFEIWRDEVNARGGLLGRPVQLVYYDDQTNGSLVPGIYTKLLDIDKVDLVVSAYATNQIAPAMPIVMQRNLLFMALFGTGVNDTFKYDKYFQILPNGRETRLAPSLGFLETAMTMNPKPQTIAAICVSNKGAGMTPPCWQKISMSCRAVDTSASALCRSFDAPDARPSRSWAGNVSGAHPRAKTMRIGFIVIMLELRQERGFT